MLILSNTMTSKWCINNIIKTCNISNNITTNNHNWLIKIRINKRLKKDSLNKDTINKINRRLKTNNKNKTNNRITFKTASRTSIITKIVKIMNWSIQSSR